MWERLVSFSWATFASSLSIFECSAEQRFNLNANFWLDFFTARVYVQRTKVVYLIHLRPFGTCKVNWHFKKKFLQRALPFVWKTRKSRGEFKWNGSSRSKFSGKKVIPFEVLPFSRFYRNDRNFLYHLFGLPGPGFKSKESEKFTVFCKWYNSIPFLFSVPKKMTVPFDGNFFS